MKTIAYALLTILLSTSLALACATRNPTVQPARGGQRAHLCRQTKSPRRRVASTATRRFMLLSNGRSTFIFT
jgi:hypothetical protein